jgi:hypothetical protein
MSTLGSIGVKLDLLIKQGSTFGPHKFTLTNPDGTLLDLTGCIVRAHIRKKASDTAIVCALDTPVTVSVTPIGEFNLGASKTVTGAITAGDTLKDPASKYVWDCDLEDSTGRSTPLYYGDVTVFREVTRV